MSIVYIYAILLSMSAQKGTKLNCLQKTLPEGLLVDASWLTKHGYSTALRTQYVKAGWLEQPARGAYRRPREKLSWQAVVISLQAMMGRQITVGGRTAIELHGYAHYLSPNVSEVFLYGPEHLPHWLPKLSLDARFTYRNDKPLFDGSPAVHTSLEQNSRLDTRNERTNAHFTALPWGQWEWPLLVSTPERAFLEVLDELPQHESFYQVDKFIDGLVNLSPRRLEILLGDCRSVKVKRLFFFFANRHCHSWLKRIKENQFNLGKGKRLLVRGGRLDSKYQITVPGDLDAH